MTVSGDGPRRVGSRLRAALAWLRIWLLTDSSADAASSRAALPAPLPNSFAARPTRSATSLPTCLKSTCFRSGTARHPLGDFLGRFVLGRLHQVAMAQDADQTAVLGDRQSADFFAFHLAGGLLNDRHEPGVFLLHLLRDVDHLVVLLGRRHGLGHRISDFHWGTSLSGRFCDFICM